MDCNDIQRAAKTVSFRDQKLTVLEILSLLQQAAEAGKTEYTYKEIKCFLNRFLWSKAETNES